MNFYSPKGTKRKEKKTKEKKRKKPLSPLDTQFSDER